MNKRFSNILLQERKIIIAAVTAGDPDLNVTGDFVRSLLKGGVHAIQIRVPFSDSVADPVLQRSDIRAIAAGATTDKIFALIQELRQETELPFVMEVYANMICTYGKEKFFSRCASAGIDGVMVPDIPLEESGEIREQCSSHSIALVPMMVPSIPERIRKIAENAQGYICLLPLGSGENKGGRIESVENIVSEAGKAASLPVIAAIGSADPAAAIELCGKTDGIIIEREIAVLVERFGASASEHILDYVRSIAAAVASPK